MKDKLDIEQVLRTLQRVAGKWEPTSEEYSSVEAAAKAMLFIHTTGQQVAFQKYTEEMKQDLTDEELKFIARLEE